MAPSLLGGGRSYWSGVPSSFASELDGTPENSDKIAHDVGCNSYTFRLLLVMKSLRDALY